MFPHPADARLQDDSFERIDF
ncbi:hypothetical protein RB2501_09145 [Robiginitalea biformata HTCC2501]|uniref:Uncharacterized protein n=1 Tax=Robiginitalea biformata (strain ATCC BAA-864 / DSM 15991 / KCTC 12146 / HTCC2501) TaxID=313596 RepID=A4CJE9_ROBBH|nr:hypothetical protein RB2501_09145 [Robiginitalea biformata HTCC2501]